MEYQAGIEKAGRDEKAGEEMKNPLSRKRLKVLLDNAARKKCHARGRCESGLHCNGCTVLNWAHIMSRSNLSVRWRMDNCFCLCQACHCYYTYHPAQFTLWVM